MDNFTTTIEGAAAYERHHALPYGDPRDEFGPDDAAPEPQHAHVATVIDYDPAKLATGEHPF